MRRTGIFLLAITSLLSGCATGYSLVTTGSVAVQNLTVNAGSGWNKVPTMHTPSARKGTQTWTKDGMLLDRLVIVPGVPDGEAILVTRNQSAALPVFRADMLPNEIEELVESSMVKLFGEGQSVVSTENLRPHRYGEHAGILFDLSATVTDSPKYRGTVGAFVAEDRLYLMYFLAALPYYYDKHRAAAEAIIQSASL